MESAAIRAGPHGPAEARAFVTSWFGGQVTSAVLEDARLLVSELVTNSLLHAQGVNGTLVDLRGSLIGNVLRLEVGDGGQNGQVVRRDPYTASGAGGFGLNLVERIATRWGVVHAKGTSVWFELGREPAA
jgi:anti-sigma regulatory factor (Ser/Thr protein kinase)